VPFFCKKLAFEKQVLSAERRTAVKLAQLGEECRGQAALCKTLQIWTRQLDEKSDTAVRHLKKQNGMKYRNLV